MLAQQLKAMLAQQLKAIMARFFGVTDYAQSPS